jgi:electron transfer flavoprotein beta subunit
MSHMEVLVCVKRVPAPGAKITLTPDGQDIDTRYLGFTIGPHEECAVEEAVRIVEQHGGSSTVLALGPPEADEQIRFAMSMGVNHGVHVLTDDAEWDPQATASAITDAIRELESERGAFDLILFGNETADAGNYQVGIRVAFALGLPIVSGIKGIEIGDDVVTLYRGIPDGFERYELPMPAAAAVKEGINLPRYPAMRERLRAKKAEVRVVHPEQRSAGLEKVRLHHPPQQETETVILGSGADAAPKVADVLEELGLI